MYVARAIVTGFMMGLRVCVCAFVSISNVEEIRDQRTACSRGITHAFLRTVSLIEHQHIIIHICSLYDCYGSREYRQSESDALFIGKGLLFFLYFTHIHNKTSG